MLIEPTSKNHMYVGSLSDTNHVQFESSTNSPKDKESEMSPGIILIHVPLFMPILYHREELYLFVKSV